MYGVKRIVGRERRANAESLRPQSSPYVQGLTKGPAWLERRKQEVGARGSKEKA